MVQCHVVWGIFDKVKHAITNDNEVHVLQIQTSDSVLHWTFKMWDIFQASLSCEQEFIFRQYMHFRHF